MILVDTSVWIDHVRASDAVLNSLLQDFAVVSHAMVIGEIAMGTMKNRGAMMELMRGLPTTSIATHDEVLGFVERRELYGKDLSFVDAHILTSVALTPGTLLWTKDKRLAAAAGLEVFRA